MENTARMIREGKVRACCMVYVESGPDMYVTSDWAAMSGKLTMIGGLMRLVGDVSSA
jgi:hypothetical protein